jgi:hypothetical protein
MRVEFGWGPQGSYALDSWLDMLLFVLILFALLQLKAGISGVKQENSVLRNQIQALETKIDSIQEVHHGP